ncbi:MAG: NADH-quinone oxidoreductase subunit [Actinomycetota bacterium]|nr:NADH-quinone oxidoreductase subunit [Actinomycetota bacterium]MDQ1478418.1 NADH-quinone oxidoreductase subunit [Actinomycetota bacterium]
MTTTESDAPEAPKKTTVTVTVDGITFEAQPGELLIKAAQENGVYIPRFCWHERMKPVGMCRMCLVEIEGGRGYPPACTTPVADGMVVHSQNDTVKQIQDGVLEFLLINHPLDCPVCDRGGECPLQDQTLAFGPGESRFVEEKRHFPKPIPLSDLILLDRERCIQCARCIRFADEIAGDVLIDFIDRGDRMQVLNFEEQPFDSYFSGNTVQICPVGALTATQYRFRARPWDLSTAETSCTTCSVQCRGAVQSSSNRLVRLLAVDSEPVNHGWLCDKGRYGLEWIHSGNRLLEPQVRDGGARREVSWPDALDRAADAIETAKELHGPSSIAVLGGARGTNEDAYVWSVLAKGVIGTDNVDAQVGDGLPADFVLGMERAEIADLDGASAIVLLDHDVRDEVPVLFLRLRRAMLELGVPLVDLAPVAHGLSPHAAVVSRRVPGERITAAVHDEITRVSEGRDGPVVVVVGRGNLAAGADSVVGVAADLARVHDVRFLSTLRRGNVHGAIDAGLAPGFLPGRTTLDAGREWFGERWGGVPAERGLDAEGILRAAGDGKIRVLVLLGSDPISDFPDATLARRAIDAVDTIIAVDAFESESTERADVFLPCTLWGEKAGTASNLEGRVQRLGRKVAPEGTAMDDWRIAGELALRLGRDLDLATVDEVTDEIARVAPAFAGVTSDIVKSARDGVVLPFSAHAAEIVLRTRDLTLMADDGAGVSWDPIKIEGETPAEPVDEAEVAAPEDAPALYEWDGRATQPDPPGRDAYALRLVVGRALYDDGRLVSETPLLQRLVGEPELRVHPSDLARIGVDSGGQVKVTSTRGSQVVAVRSDAGVPAGIACMDFSADALGAALLIDASQPVVDLRVESLR